MVSIFADTVASDTFDIELDDGVKWRDIPEPTFTTNANITDFIYLQDVSIDVISNDITLTNNTLGSGAVMGIEADLKFNDVIIATFAKNQIGRISVGENENVTDNFDSENTIVSVDGYVDGPLEIEYKITTSIPNNRNITSVGDQTLTTDIEFSFVGRTP